MARPSKAPELTFEQKINQRIAAETEEIVFEALVNLNFTQHISPDIVRHAVDRYLDTI